MVRKKLDQIFERARQRRDKNQGLPGAVHIRLGHLQPGEVAVILAVAAPHREEAFSCCRFLLEKLKSEVPIWKKEFFNDSEIWVENKGDFHA
jgi:molybdopterin synthase catalytic subunit